VAGGRGRGRGDPGVELGRPKHDQAEDHQQRRVGEPLRAGAQGASKGCVWGGTRDVLRRSVGAEARRAGGARRDSTPPSCHTLSCDPPVPTLSPAILRLIILWPPWALTRSYSVLTLSSPGPQLPPRQHALPRLASPRLSPLLFSALTGRTTRPWTPAPRTTSSGSSAPAASRHSTSLRPRSCKSSPRGVADDLRRTASTTRV
jgi:hypothetical protein